MDTIPKGLRADVILLGAGSSRERKLLVGGKSDFDGQTVLTVDIEPRHGTDVVWNLEHTPWPFDDNCAEEIHAYEVLEHLGEQGDMVSFFAHFYEIWRILKPDGHVAVTVPAWNSEWAWGDPGHRRVITPGTLFFLSQPLYKSGVGRTTMSDYRSLWKGDFEKVASQVAKDTHAFVLRAVKPVRA